MCRRTSSTFADENAQLFELREGRGLLRAGDARGPDEGFVRADRVTREDHAGGIRTARVNVSEQHAGGVLEAVVCPRSKLRDLAAGGDLAHYRAGLEVLPGDYNDLVATVEVVLFVLEPVAQTIRFVDDRHLSLLLSPAARRPG